MSIVHLLVAGPAEAIFTAGVVAWLARRHWALLEGAHAELLAGEQQLRHVRRAWLTALAVTILATPLACSPSAAPTPRMLRKTWTSVP